ncbi:hypothetical protein IKQ26_00605 [bacterium]|nr:hypothetical protein [bacterium]
MGKSKKRIFNRNKNENGTLLKREDALLSVVKAVKSNNLTPEAQHLIGIFGFSREELSENGLTYEELKLLPHFC